MDFPSETKMVAALVQAAMLDSLEKQVTIANVAGFKATVERRLYEGEAAHAGYIKLAYKAMTRRRRGDPDDDLPNRPPPIDDVLDDENHPVATPEDAARWRRIIDLIHTVDETHPLRIAIRETCNPDTVDDQGNPIVHAETDALQILEYLELVAQNEGLAKVVPTTVPDAEEWMP